MQFEYLIQPLIDTNERIVIGSLDETQTESRKKSKFVA